ncbi:MAG: hypothetical protein H7Y28_09250 [Rhodoferax sp.]|nr:hypothetical protein [Rhodoferax sp.]
MEDIDARIQDFGFKTHFLREMQMIARVNAMANDANGPVGSVERKLTRRHFHMIDSDLKVLQRSDTKMLAHGPFLDMLHDEGLACARAWLSQHGDRLGQASTVDLRQWLT